MGGGRPARVQLRRPGLRTPLLHFAYADPRREGQARGQGQSQATYPLSSAGDGRSAPNSSSCSSGSSCGGRAVCRRWTRARAAAHRASLRANTRRRACSVVIRAGTFAYMQHVHRCMKREGGGSGRAIEEKERPTSPDCLEILKQNMMAHGSYTGKQRPQNAGKGGRAYTTSLHAHVFPREILTHEIRHLPPRYTPSGQ